MLQAEGEDELKKRQLMELAIINGTYRDSNTKALVAAGTEYYPIFIFATLFDIVMIKLKKKKI